MADVWVTVFVVGFFFLCFLYVRVCDRIIGPDREMLPADDEAGAGAPDPARR